MKNIALLILASFISFSVVAEEKKEEPVEPKTKKVCIKRVDAKTKEEKEVCRNMKVHKKLEGTKVPEKK